MPIVNLVPELLRQRFPNDKGGVNLSEAQRTLGFNYRTIRDWNENRVSRTDFDTYEKWCDFFGVDVLHYEPDKRDE